MVPPVHKDRTEAIKLLRAANQQLCWSKRNQHRLYLYNYILLHEIHFVTKLEAYMKRIG